jgi:hypothetical protein
MPLPPTQQQATRGAAQQQQQQELLRVALTRVVQRDAFVAMLEHELRTVGLL